MGSHRVGHDLAAVAATINKNTFVSKLWEMVKDREAWHPWGCKEPDTTERLNSSNKRRERGWCRAPGKHADG